MPDSAAHVELKTPLGNKFLVVRVEGQEGVSELFEFRVRFVDEDAAADPVKSDKLIGEACHTELTYDWAALGFPGTNMARKIHGLCTDFRFLGKLDRLNHYEITLRPRMWLATRNTHSRFFLDKTLNDIFNAVLSADPIGVTDKQMDFSPHDPLHFTVQFQETDFAFLSRLMEKYGIAYIFEHSDSGHKVHFRDARGALSDAGSFPHEQDSTGIKDHPYMTSVATVAHLRTNKSAVRDWDYESAGAVLKDDDEVTVNHGSKGSEIYVYPAGWTQQTSSHAKHLAGVIADTEIGQSQRLQVAGFALTLFPGESFKITDSPVIDETKFIVLRAHHVFTQTLQFTSGGTFGSSGYHGVFEAIKDSVNYPSPKITPWPRISGPQTAIVTGKQGEEIDIDEDGRILVLFHWDRDQKASCRIRVAQLWAGKQWGSVFTPRIGMEVVVEFIGGDPDRPLVTGCVYNSENKFVAKVETKTVSGIKSDSTKGDGKDGFHIIAIDDKLGEEIITIRSEKDILRIASNDEIVRIKRNQNMRVTGSRTTEITAGDDTLTLKGTSAQDKDGNSIAASGHRTVTLNKGNDKLTLDQGNREVKLLQGNDTLKISVGNLTIGVDAGKTEVKAAQSIELKCGGSSIKLTPDSVTIKGMQVKIEGSMTFEAKGGITAKVEGGAMNTVKGGIVMIN